MKKFFILMLSTLCTWSAYAQYSEDSFTDDVSTDRSFTISVGPKVGLSFTTMSDSEIDLGTKLGTGFSGGLAANFHFGRRTAISKGGTGLFGLQVEAMYTLRNVGTDSDDMKFNMIEVPILAQLYVTQNIFIEAGPTFVVAMSASPENISLDKQFVAIDEMKANDMMLTVGVGYKHSNGLFASARYNIGTSDVAGNFDSKMSTISLSIGWLFKVVR